MFTLILGGPSTDYHLQHILISEVQDGIFDGLADF